MTSASGYSRLNFQESKSVIEDKIIESQTQSSLLSQNMAEEFAKGQGERWKDEFGIGRSYLFMSFCRKLAVNESEEKLKIFVRKLLGKAMDENNELMDAKLRQIEKDVVIL